MKWTQASTRQYLNEHGIQYHEYLTVMNTMVLDYEWCPYRMLLAHGELGDSVEDHGRNGHWEIVAVLARDTLILRDDNVYQLVDRRGMDGDAQVGGTLEGFITFQSGGSPVPLGRGGNPSPF